MIHRIHVNIFFKVRIFLFVDWLDSNEALHYFFRNIRQKLNYIFKFNENQLEKDHTWTTPQKRMLNVILEIIHGRLIKCLSIQFVEKRVYLIPNTSATVDLLVFGQTACIASRRLGKMREMVRQFYWQVPLELIKYHWLDVIPLSLTQFQIEHQRN